MRSPRFAMRGGPYRSAAIKDRPAATKPPARKSGDSFKDTFESIVIAFILAFVFRAYVVEAFVIPTGSMAPTLLGQHLDVNCQQCGHRFAVDPPDQATVERIARQQGNLQWTQSIQRPYITEAQRPICPMCHFPNLLAQGTRVRSGDRILVQKYVYSLTEPRRWDVAVFKNPQEPGINFIKRLVGLPGERLWLIEGRAYVQPLSSPDSAWRIARKTDRPQVQRTVWRPIYHSRYEPLDGGAASLARRGANPRQDHVWQRPWRPDTPDRWQMQGPSYHYDSPDQEYLRFDFDRLMQGGPGWFEYNQLRQSGDDTISIEDIRLAVAFQPSQPGLSVALSTTARLDEDDPTAPARPIVAAIDADGQAEIYTLDPQDGRKRVLASESIGAFRPGIARQVEFWFVDQQASLWIDGRQRLSWSFELSIDTLTQRPALRQLPRINLAVAGSPVTLHRVELDRDLYYTSAQHGRAQAGLGSLFKMGAGRGYRGEPVTLGDDQFFALGDNSPMSSDSRYWDRIDPWVEHRLVQAGQQAEGVVPRDLMMGRAFFVYWPAPRAWRPTQVGLFPNFADMRQIH